MYGYDSHGKDFVHDADYDYLYDVHGDKDISVDDENDHNCDKMRMVMKMGKIAILRMVNMMIYIWWPLQCP